MSLKLITSSIFRENLFQDQVALVTGGGSGIGFRIAKELAALGAWVFVAGRKVAKVEEAARQLVAWGGRATALEMNIRQVESVEKALDLLLSQTHGRLDLLVNNAGGQFPSPAEQISPKGWVAVIDTNLNGTFYVTQSVFNKLRHGASTTTTTAPPLAIVNIVACYRNGFPLMSHTAAARSGVATLTRTLAIEWAARGVRINCVAPGVIDSSGLDSYSDAFQQGVRKSYSRAYAWRMGTVEECAAATLFLLSPAATYITGQCLEVDGGLTLFNPLFPPSEHQLSIPFVDPPSSSASTALSSSPAVVSKLNSRL